MRQVSTYTALYMTIQQEAHLGPTPRSVDQQLRARVGGGNGVAVTISLILVTAINNIL